MEKTVEILPARQTCRDEKGIPNEGQWKVKAWKGRPSAARDRPASDVPVHLGHCVPLPLSSPSSRQRQRPRPIDQRLNTSRRRLKKWSASWISAGIGAALILTVSSYWPERLTLPNGLILAEARTFSSLERHAADAPYRLQLGRYQDEIGARYAWIAYQASLGGPLDDWEPRFEQVVTKGSPTYRILAGTFFDLHEAGHLCAHLQIRDVPCKPVKRE